MSKETLTKVLEIIEGRTTDLVDGLSDQSAKNFLEGMYFMSMMILRYGLITHKDVDGALTPLEFQRFMREIRKFLVEKGVDSSPFIETMSQVEEVLFAEAFYISAMMQDYLHLPITPDDVETVKESQEILSKTNSASLTEALTNLAMGFEGLFGVTDLDDFDDFGDLADLDGFGDPNDSGSGLLDLSLHADDTSLSAVLDDVLPDMPEVVDLNESSGSGLLDLTLDADDTSLGTVLDDQGDLEDESGSGLLDLTLDADDTSLGAVLDDILPKADADSKKDPEENPKKPKRRGILSWVWNLRFKPRR